MSAASSPVRHLLRRMSEELGYEDELREEDFPTWRGDVVDLVCFGDRERHDMSTSLIVVGQATGDRERERQFRHARMLAAPVCVLRSEVDCSRPVLTGQAAVFCSGSPASSQVWRTSDGVR